MASPGSERWSITRGVIARFVAWLVPIAALLVIYPVVLYQRERVSERRLHEQENLRVVDVGMEAVTRDFSSVVADLRYLADQSVFRDYLAGRPGAETALKQDLRAFSLYKGMYDQIRFLDATGAEALRVNYAGGSPIVVPDPELQSRAAFDAFSKTIGLEPGEVYVAPFEVNAEQGEIEHPLKPVIRFATPVHHEGRPAGVLMLTYLGRSILEKIRDISASYRGDVLLINGDGFYLLHPRMPEAEWGFQLGPGPNFATDHPLAWREVASRPSGSVITPEGLFTFRHVGPRWTPGRGVVLVARRPSGQLDERSKGLLRHVLSAYAVAVPVLLALIGYLAVAGEARRRQQTRIAESEARLRVLSTQLLTAQERERSAVSRDLHDDLGQVVTAIGLDLEEAERAGDPAEKERLVGEALEATRSLMERVRTISARLRPRMLDDLGLKDAVRSFLADCETQLGVVAEADLRFDAVEIPPEVSEHVYRIVQEAVTNVARHAGVKRCSVGIRVTGELVRLSVSDSGTGFDPDAVEGRGLGLLGMRERTRLLGGSFRLESAPGAGTRIDAVIPIADRPDGGRR